MTLSLATSRKISGEYQMYNWSYRRQGKAELSKSSKRINGLKFLTIDEKYKFIISKAQQVHNMIQRKPHPQCRKTVEN